MVFGIAVAVGRSSVFLLNVRRVGQDDRAQLTGGAGAEYPAAKPVAHQAREVPAVIEVGMSQHDRVD
jgi:hypothetical protein